MPSPTPSVARVKNVLEAIRACGLVPGEVRVEADGSFTVATREPLAPQADSTPPSPPKWGQRR